MIGRVHECIGLDGGGGILSIFMKYNLKNNTK